MFSSEWKDALWDRFFTAATKSVAEYVKRKDNLTKAGAQHYAATLRKTSAVARVELEASMETRIDAWRHYVKPAIMAR